ncbi:MAG: 16S rRNA (cytidine(1402)-2'-O)-methyltransferase [Anaerolineales bacterium]|nr:MAG: 16S rRNA (cytidine(1402)-2'-O)-methyltransferase [Anaerolineales bacterium]
MATLYVVGTPIGNLEDVSLRALRILREAALIAAEDTRQTRKLLTRYEITTPLTSYYEHNKLAKLDYILTTLEEKDIALVSEAGMPGISDPGYELIKAAIARGIPVVPVPGPSALVTALAISGLPTDSFVYLGFLPRRQGERRRLLGSLAGERRTLVAFEAPHRLRKSLADLVDVLGDRQIAVARELTKIHEEVWRGSLSQALEHFERTPPRGEFTLVIAGAEDEAQVAWDEEQVRAALAELLSEGLDKKEAIKQVAKAAHWPRRQVYKVAVDVQRTKRI